jgi:FixJ family two-component response regulator
MLAPWRSARYDRGMHTVALVDCLPYLAPTLGMLLEPHGFRVIWFESGKEMLEKYDPVEGCVLMDVFLWYMNGLEVLESFRSRWGVPVIITDCGDYPENRRQAMALGAFDYIVKPWKTPDLIDLLKEACEYSDVPTIVDRSPRERPYCG